MNDNTRKGDHDMEKHIFQVCLLGERNGSRTAIADMLYVEVSQEAVCC
jgi:hypothetical protein